jgi:hypothetical protein
VVHFDSSGGSLAEALQLGRFLREHLMASVIADGKSCIGACAWAFLGGSSGYATGGHEPNRSLGDGRLIFTPFEYQPGEVGIVELIAYAARMDVGLDWVGRFLSLRQTEVLPVPSQNFDATYTELPPLRDGTAADRAVTSCNQATGWRQPLVSTDAGAPNPARPVAKVQSLTMRDFKMKLLTMALAQKDSQADGPLAARVRLAIANKDDAALDAVIAELRAINWPFNFEQAGPTFLITGWQKTDDFAIDSCLVMMDYGYRGSRILLLGDDGSEFHNVEYDDDIRQNYQKPVLSKAPGGEQ